MTIAKELVGKTGKARGLLILAAIALPILPAVGAVMPKGAGLGAEPKTVLPAAPAHLLSPKPVEPPLSAAPKPMDLELETSLKAARGLDGLEREKALGQVVSMACQRGRFALALEAAKSSAYPGTRDGMRSFIAETAARTQDFDVAFRASGFIHTVLTRDRLLLGIVDAARRANRTDVAERAANAIKVPANRAEAQRRIGK